MADRATRTIEKGDLVCVTGASGFIGSHVVDALLSAGYAVRATVRDADDEAKTAQLRRLEGADERLEIVSADLMKPGSFDDAVADCPYVCHVAASVKLRAKDPQREIVDVAVKGTHNVLDSIDKAGAARRVVMTSSIAAIVDETKPSDFVHDESCWNESSTLEESPYPLAKALSEKAAWARYEKLDPADRYGFVTVNPTLVLGPVRAKVHVRSSPAIIRDLMAGKFPMIPNFRFGVVDVRDVALAHVRALQRPAEGRHLLNAEAAWLTDLAKIVRDAFPDAKVPRFRMPNPLMYAVAIFDKRLSWSFLRRNLGNVTLYDNAKSKTSLGMQYRTLEDTLKATGRSFVDLGLL